MNGPRDSFPLRAFLSDKNNRHSPALIDGPRASFPLRAFLSGKNNRFSAALMDGPRDSFSLRACACGERSLRIAPREENEIPHPFISSRTGEGRPNTPLFGWSQHSLLLCCRWKPVLLLAFSLAQPSQHTTFYTSPLHIPLSYTAISRKDINRTFRHKHL